MSIPILVDLSHPLFTGMPVHPGDPVVQIEPAATIEKDGFSVLSVHMGSQSGTHVDAPFHFLTSGLRIDEIALEWFYGLGCIIDVRHVGCGEISVTHLDDVNPPLAQLPHYCDSDGLGCSLGNERVLRASVDISRPCARDGGRWCNNHRY